MNKLQTSEQAAIELRNLLESGVEECNLTRLLRIVANTTRQEETLREIADRQSKPEDVCPECGGCISEGTHILGCKQQEWQDYPCSSMCCPTGCVRMERLELLAKYDFADHPREAKVISKIAQGAIELINELRAEIKVLGDKQ